MMLDQTAKKALGQHFLRDPNAISRIVAALPVGARAIEIGPGPGAITQPLLERASELTAIERDDRFAGHWQQIAAQNDKLHVVHGDVMQELLPTVAAFRPEWIAGNLPYNISGPLTAMLASISLSGGMVLMYQREVAERIAADAGGRDYGGLSVLVRHHYTVRRLLTLPPGAFSPPPKVHSAVLLLTPHGQSPACSYEALQRTVRQGFAHRRKTIANNFRGTITTDAWAAMEINAGDRPEQLPYAAWVRISRHLNRD